LAFGCHYWLAKVVNDTNSANLLASHVAALQDHRYRESQSPLTGGGVGPPQSGIVCLVGLLVVVHLPALGPPFPL